MKKYAYAAAVILISGLMAHGAWSEEQQDAAQQDPQTIENRKAEEALQLKNRKEEMTLSITNRMAEMQKSKDCIDAATDMKSLQKCMPRGGGKGGPGMMGGGHGMMGGQGGMMQGGGSEGGMMPPPSR